MAIRTCIFCDAVHDANNFCDDWDVDGCPQCDNSGGITTTLQPRIDSIHDALEIEYAAAHPDNLEQFERLLHRIETAISKYRYIRYPMSQK